MYGRDQVETGELYRITKHGLEIYSRERMLETGYLNPSQDRYYVFSIEAHDAGYLNGCRWDIQGLKNYNTEKKPFFASLAELVKKRTRDLG